MKHSDILCLFVDSWGNGFYCDSDVNLTKKCVIYSWQVWGCLGHDWTCIKNMYFAKNVL